MYKNIYTDKIIKFTLVVAILLTKDTCLKPLSDRVTATSQRSPAFSYTNFKGFPESSSLPLIYKLT